MLEKWSDVKPHKGGRGSQPRTLRARIDHRRSNPKRRPLGSVGVLSRMRDGQEATPKQPTATKIPSPTSKPPRLQSIPTRRDCRLRGHSRQAERLPYNTLGGKPPQLPPRSSPPLNRGAGNARLLYSLPRSQGRKTLPIFVCLPALPKTRSSPKPFVPLCLRVRKTPPSPPHHSITPPRLPTPSHEKKTLLTPDFRSCVLCLQV